MASQSIKTADDYWPDAGDAKIILRSTDSFYSWSSHAPEKRFWRPKIGSTATGRDQRYKLDFRIRKAGQTFESNEWTLFNGVLMDRHSKACLP